MSDNSDDNKTKIIGQISTTNDCKSKWTQDKLEN